MEYMDISGWESKVSSTKGTRDKYVVFSPNDRNMYFIKFPMVREGRDYSMETWSEILAYEIGSRLGFDVLKYDFAVKDGRAGCISKNMVEGDGFSLVEGDSILTAFDPLYNPEDKKMYSKYTFPFVMKALEHQGLEKWKGNFVRMLLFDAVIGNSDRHQGNWGFVQQITKGERRKFGWKKQEYTNIEKKFAPIYDSGCCLGREFSEEQIAQKLAEKDKIISYVSKGQAELRTGTNPTKKVSHFELLGHIISMDEWRMFLADEIKSLLSRYSREKIHAVISNIDDPVPKDKKKNFGMSDSRKEFVAMVIDARIKKIREIYETED